MSPPEPDAPAPPASPAARSIPTGGAGRSRSHRIAPSRWTLRTRLVVALVALLAVTITAVGALTVVALDRFLVGRLDDQLVSAGSRARAEADRRPGLGHDAVGQRGPGPGPGFLTAPGQATGTIGAIVFQGQLVDAAVLDSSGTVQALPLSADSALADVPGDGQPRSVDLGEDVGSYRVVGIPGPAGAVVVTGLPLEPVNQTVQQLAVIITVVALVGLAAAAAAATVIISISLRPLRRVAATAAQVAGMPLDSGEVALAVRVPDRDTDPHTEVGQVGAAINHMLENVATALTVRHLSEMRVRSFVADASHELRTPLASIRGYAELTRRSDTELPPDAANALDRIESESIRMTSLVEDLLLLARLDAGRPIEFAPVDISALVVTCVNDAHVSGPDHVWQLRLPDEPVTVSGDQDRLHQVVGNLLTNARIHTPSGTVVTIDLTVPISHETPTDSTITADRSTPTSGGADAAATTPDWVAIRVHDNGPGIPNDLQPELFERFTRADTSRSRAAGSTGLGLAIVSAVVGAHNGTITADSRPGDTTFVLYLPVA